MKNNRSVWTGLIAGVVAAVLVLGTFAFIDNRKPDKTAYIVTQQLFGSFQGTKELKKKLVKLEEQNKIILDSMALDISLLEKRFGTENAKVLSEKNKYNAIYTEMSNNYQQEVKKSDDASWQQINQYVSEFGKEKGYSFIYGASGNGSLMFAMEQKNITEEVAAYINKKYAE